MALRPASPERLQSDLDDLAGMTEDGPGWTRRLFSEVEVASRPVVAAKMAAAGLEVSRDGAGNLIGRLAGTAGLRPALVTGSHTDTVTAGGRFDGVVGVVGGLEVVRLLAESGVRLAHDLWVVDFRGEEPNRHGIGYVGSRAITGTLRPAHLAERSPEGITLGDALLAGGGDPDAALRAAWAPGQVAAYLELHVEQGPHLERRGTSIGVVQAVVGIQRLSATFTGRADHAGTRPMGMRHDAGCAAAEAMVAIERMGVLGAEAADGGAVATVGALEVTPGAINVVPGLARMLAESRSTDQGWLTSFRLELEAELARAAGARGVGVEVDWLELEAPTPMAASVSSLVAGAADRLGYDRTDLASFAGHDAAQMAAIGPTGMIFVPSREGRSHCPEEWTDPGDVVAGVQVLAEALVAADTAF
jgi:N-carbamoyl-L-amino-acid hydrolase